MVSLLQTGFSNFVVSPWCNRSFKREMERQTLCSTRVLKPSLYVAYLWVIFMKFNCKYWNNASAAGIIKASKMNKGSEAMNIFQQIQTPGASIKEYSLKYSVPVD